MPKGLAAFLEIAVGVKARAARREQHHIARLHQRLRDGDRCGQIARPAKGRRTLPERAQGTLDEAGKSGKLVLIDIYSDYCPPCREMEEKTWPDPKVVAASRDFVCLKINSDENQEVPGKYGTQFIPHVVFAKADGSAVLEDTGFKSPEDLVAMMEDAKSK